MAAPEEKLSTVAVAMLIDDLRSEESKKRLNSVNHLPAIAQALGGERTRTELIPFLAEFSDDDDEILVSLAEVLGNFVDLVGGSSHALTLIKPLEQLACAEEGIVRDKAIESLKKVLAVARIKENEGDIMNLIKRFVKDIDSFTGKIAAAAIAPICFPNVNYTSQNDITNIYRALAKDQSIQVRKAASANFKVMVQNIPNRYPESEATSLFQQFCKDEQDLVRFPCVDTLLCLCQTVPTQKSAGYVTAFIKASAEDKSWRMRYVVAEKIVELGKYLGPESLVEIYTSFLQDPEGEIKAISASKASEFCKFMDSSNIIRKVMPLLKKLSNDPLVHVRSIEAFSENLLALAPLVGTANTNEHILPMFLALLKDESADVRLPLLKNLEDLNKVVGIETLSSSLIPAINQLAGDKKWRIRMTVMDYSPILAKIMGESLFQERFGDLCLSWLDDNVYAVREHAMKKLKDLTVVLGSHWAEKYALPKLISYQMHANYLFRMTPLFAIPLLAPHLSPASLEKTVVPFILNQIADKVPNIRFNVAKVLKAIAPLVKNPSLQSAITKALGQLASDSDADVKYYSTKYATGAVATTS